MHNKDLCVKQDDWLIQHPVGKCSVFFFQTLVIHFSIVQPQVFFCQSIGTHVPLHGSLLYITHLINVPSIYTVSNPIQILSYLFHRCCGLFTMSPGETDFCFLISFTFSLHCDLLNVTMLPGGHIKYTSNL